MRARLGRLSREEAGQSIVTIGLMSVFILTILAIVLDTGFIYMDRRDLQNAADAAALAGAQELNGTQAGYDAAAVDAQAWANKNVSNLKSFTAEPLNNYTAIKVTVRKDSNGHILGSISSGDKDVGAKATAGIKSLNGFACVVPLGVEASVYQQATSTNPGPEVALKVAVQSGPGGSNTGFLKLGSGALKDTIWQGSGCGLTPTPNTDPGGTVGNVRDGFTTRLKAAIDRSCYTWDQVQPTPDPKNWTCKPENSMVSISKNQVVQATSVILIPILATDIVKSGSNTYPVATTPDGRYLLAYFWVDGDATFGKGWQTKNNPKCVDDPQCYVYGRFLQNVPADLSVYNKNLCPGGNKPCVIPFDPNALFKIVSLIE